MAPNTKSNKILAQGAEAILTRKENVVIKERPSKSYRHPAIDTKLRKFRTRREAKVLSKLEKIQFPSPRLIRSDDKNMTIEMEFIKGTLIKDKLDKNPKQLAKEIGQKLGILHNNNIIHADLTTSNMILNQDTNEICFIDFGLSFFSHKEEDKACDLHLLSRAMESQHHKVFPDCFLAAIEGYKETYQDPNLILDRLEKVESRGRYKKKKKRVKKNK